MHSKKLFGINTLSCSVGSMGLRPEWPWRARRYKIVPDESGQYWYLFLFPHPLAMLFFHLSSDLWWQYKKWVWRLSLILRNSVASSFSLGRLPSRRRWINFFTMNKDACNVEDINIHHITECFSLSSATFIEERFCLFRTRSFTLFKNDLDPNDNSDSFWSSSMTNCCAPRWGQTTVSLFYRDFLLLPKWSACVHERNAIETRVLLFEGKQRVSPFYHPSIHQLLFSGLSDAEDDRVEGALAIKLIIGLDFAVTLSSPESCCVLFDITSEQSVELKWLTLNKHKRWFHSSRAEFPLVSMSASFFLVSRNLIWIFGSNLIRSNNQSRATLWVLETCLIVGLPPFKTILITASLSSNTNNKASWCENWTFEWTKSTLFKTLNIPRDCWPCAWLASRQTTGFTVQSWFRVVFPRTETIRSHKSRAGIPSDLNPASKEMISDSVELFETEVCFLHIQLIETNVRLPKTHNVPPWGRFWVLKISRKIGVLKQSPVCIVL